LIEKCFDTFAALMPLIFQSPAFPRKSFEFQFANLLFFFDVLQIEFGNSVFDGLVCQFRIKTIDLKAKFDFKLQIVLSL
jgi:hypothetical protein